VKVYLSSGRFLGVEDGSALYAVPDQGLLNRAEPLLPEVDAALSSHFGRPVPLRLVLDPGAQPARGSRGTDVGAGGSDPVGNEGGGHEDLEDLDVAELQDAPAAALTPEQRLLEAFPGAEEVTP
jgi:hypothetical protein